MFNFGSTTMKNTSLFGQSTPVNQNRLGNNFLFGNTTAIPPSTSFSSANLLGTTMILQSSSLESTTYPKYKPASGLITNDIQPSTTLTQVSNEQRFDDHNNQKLSLSSTFVTAPASTTLNSFSFGHKSPPTTTSSMTFSFANSQPSTSPRLGNSSSFFPTTTTTTTNTPFNFSSSSKATITSSSTTTIPILFSTTTAAMNQLTTTTTSAADLKLFQTMLTTQPFNNELTFLARNIQPNLSRDRTRLRTESATSTIRPKNNPFLSVLTKPSVLSVTPLSSNHPLSTHSNKRKLADSFLDDDYEKNLLVTDDGPSSTMNISKLNIKRPRMLDMNKIRSVVLGANESMNETFMSKSSTSENVTGWKQFPCYDEYLSSKKPDRRSFHLPKLTQKDYYTKPTIEELRSYFNEQGQCLVKRFTVGRKHYGSVTFQGSHMNLAGLDLDRLVEIDRRQVTVYPDEKDRPAEGEELNCQAVISLFGVYPIDRSIASGGEEVTDSTRLTEMNYDKYLEGMTRKFHGHFIDYDVETGTWTFRVEHF